jgi:hypothetical protein
VTPPKLGRGVGGIGGYVREWANVNLFGPRNEGSNHPIITANTSAPGIVAVAWKIGHSFDRFSPRCIPAVTVLAGTAHAPAAQPTVFASARNAGKGSILVYTLDGATRAPVFAAFSLAVIC